MLDFEHNHELQEKMFEDYQTEARRTGYYKTLFMAALRQYANTVCHCLKQVTAERMYQLHKDLVLPEPGTRWIHNNTRNIYVVDGLRNLQSTDLIKYPYKVLYTRENDGSEWVRDAYLWHESFTPYNEDESCQSSS